MAEPGDRERRDGTGGRDEDGLSDLAQAYRKAAPYTAATTNLVVAVGAGTWLGHWADGKLGFEVPWLTLLGALLGMAGGFISFFRIVLRKDQARKP